MKIFNTKTQRGFTLLEMMTVLGIMSILSALAISGLRSFTAGRTPDNAAFDLSSAISKARAMAVERSSDVYLIIYETLSPTGGSTGAGAYFTYEDPDFLFRATTPAAVAGEIRFNTFNPPALMTPTGGRGRLLDSVYLDRYSGQNIRFGLTTTPLTFTQPFTNLNPPIAACSFCSGSPRRGAIVFHPNGQAAFVNGSGVDVVPSLTASGRAGYVGLGSKDNNRAFLYALSGPTGYVAMESR